MSTMTAKVLKERERRRLLRRIGRNWELYLYLLPAVVVLFLFSYMPMYGVQIAFKDFKILKGIEGSDWVGLKHFVRFLGLPSFGKLIRNTLTLSIYSLLAGFPLPIILALALNTCENDKFKKFTQTVTYAPHFISTVILVGMINLFFAPSNGVFTVMLRETGLLEGNLTTLMNESAFKHLYVWSTVWSGLGWNSIVYLSALSGVDPSLHEAAIVDGANKLQRCRHIDLPCILPTIIMLLILRLGNMMDVGFQKAYLMQNSMNINASEVLSTFVYKTGIKDAQYSYAASVDLFNSVINFVLVISVNWISRKVSETSLW